MVRTTCCSNERGQTLHLARAETTIPINTKVWVTDYVVRQREGKMLSIGLLIVTSPHVSEIYSVLFSAFFYVFSSCYVDQATDHNSSRILTHDDSKDVVWHTHVPFVCLNYFRPLFVGNNPQKAPDAEIPARSGVWFQFYILSLFSSAVYHNTNARQNCRITLNSTEQTQHVNEAWYKVRIARSESAIINHLQRHQAEKTPWRHFRLTENFITSETVHDSRIVTIKHGYNL